MTGENIRKSLHGGERVYGIHVTGLSNALVTRLLGTAPLDFAFVCNEHMPVDRAETAVLCQHFQSMGISPIVRIPCPDPCQAAMAIDGGAQGIVAPYVETEEEVRRLVGAVHYRPIKGRQLHDILTGRRQPAEATRAFLRRFNRHHYAIIGIESVAACENLDALIGIDGVDGVFLGPHDLSVSLEVPEQWDSPALLGLMEDTIRRCRAAGIGVGVHVSHIFSLEQIRRFIALGMNWILDGSDIAHTLHNCEERRRALCGAPAAASPFANTGPAPCIAPAANGAGGRQSPSGSTGGPVSNVSVLTRAD